MGERERETRRQTDRTWVKINRHALQKKKENVLLEFNTWPPSSSTPHNHGWSLSEMFRLPIYIPNIWRNFVWCVSISSGYTPIYKTPFEKRKRKDLKIQKKKMKQVLWTCSVISYLFYFIFFHQSPRKWSTDAIFFVSFLFFRKRKVKIEGDLPTHRGKESWYPNTIDKVPFSSSSFFYLFSKRLFKKNVC